MDQNTKQKKAPSTYETLEGVGLNIAFEEATSSTTPHGFFKTDALPGLSVLA